MLFNLTWIIINKFMIYVVYSRLIVRKVITLIVTRCHVWDFLYLNELLKCISKIFKYILNYVLIQTNESSLFMISLDSFSFLLHN